MKESRKFWISAEGENCECLYFEHLQDIINESDSSIYNAKIIVKKASPCSFAKRNAYRPADNRPDGGVIPYMHIQDVEDYASKKHRDKFYGIIDEMRLAEEEFNISYELGYSNYSFELWMLLHVANMNYQISHRYDYLEPVNRYFGKSYKSLDDFKKHDEFQSILNEHVTVKSVKDAIARAEKLEVRAASDPANVFEEYRRFGFFHENPHTTVHEIVKLIFEVCKVH